jgi:sortase A
MAHKTRLFFSTRHKKQLWALIAGSVLALCGLALLLYPVIGAAQTQQVEDLLMQSLPMNTAVYVDPVSQPGEIFGEEDPEAQLADIPYQDPGASVAGNVTDEPATTDSAQAGKISLKCMGILTIEKIGLKAPILQGMNRRNLSYGLAHMKGTAGIGETGSCCIFGHRCHTFGKFFNRLDDVSVGDAITILDARGTTHHYKVAKKEVLLPYDSGLLNGGLSGRVISLITCTPPGVASHRLVVRAVEQ